MSLINGCAYCIDMHSRDLLKRGMAVEKLVLVPVWREAGDLFSERERAALAWAETVTRVADTAVPDADYRDAAAAFSEKELADLTIAIALMNAYNRLAVSFRTPPAAAQRRRSPSARARPDEGPRRGRERRDRARVGRAAHACRARGHRRGPVMGG